MNHREPLRAFQTLDSTGAQLSEGDIVTVMVRDIQPEGDEDGAPEPYSGTFTVEGEVVQLHNDHVFFTQHGNGGYEGWCDPTDLTIVLRAADRS